MSLVFYCARLSSSVTVHWALEGARDQDKGDFLALNLNGKVALLVHDVAWRDRAYALSMAP